MAPSRSTSGHTELNGHILAVRSHKGLPDAKHSWTSGARTLHTQTSKVAMSDCYQLHTQASEVTMSHCYTRTQENMCDEGLSICGTRQANTMRAMTGGDEHGNETVSDNLREACTSM